MIRRRMFLQKITKYISLLLISFLVLNIAGHVVTALCVACKGRNTPTNSSYSDQQNELEETIKRTLNDFCTVDTAHVQWCCSVQTSLVPTGTTDHVLTFSHQLNVEWQTGDRGEMEDNVRVTINRQHSTLCRYAQVTPLLNSATPRRRRRSTLTPVELLLPPDIVNQLLTDSSRRDALRSELQQDILIIFLQSLNVSDVVIQSYGTANNPAAGSSTQSSSSSSSSLPLWAILDIVIGCLLFIIIVLLIILCCCCCNKRCTGSENREQSRFHSQPIMRDSAVTRPRETRDKAINTSLVSTKTSESKNIPPHKSDGGETSRQSQEKLGKGTTSKQSSAASKGFATDRRRGIKVVPLPPSTHDSSTDMTFDPPCRSFVDMVAADLDDDNTALDRPPSQQTLTHNYYNELNYV